ncbi:toluene-4-monooxygenase system B family protein [Pseudonocardia endophytica]|uniref:Toluene monooxygenase system protein B n=1 Tax=Pseudonocardia endophytica TaxID=401976 RepID=A0A4R1HXU2_PSEEN|nr:toluene-4-monooxygenase system B family protein [Pseudonocardia endophytica]TCK27597.1 toluene monooxygenase system protein B [Pseudonocardia endophytica]
MGNPMPVVAHFRGDFLYNLVLIEDTDSVADVGRKCAEHSVGRRVPEQDAPYQVEYAGSLLADSLTASEAGIEPMEEVIVSYAAR